MPNKLPKDAIGDAEAAVVFAQGVRKLHRRRSDRTAEDREADLRRAMERIQAAMKPLRSEIGRFPYGPQTERAERNRDKIREASEALQRERRKLWKMLPKEKSVART